MLQLSTRQYLLRRMQTPVNPPPPLSPDSHLIQSQDHSPSHHTLTWPYYARKSDITARESRGDLRITWAYLRTYLPISLGMRPLRPDSISPRSVPLSHATQQELCRLGAASITVQWICTQDPSIVLVRNWTNEKMRISVLAPTSIKGKRS